eukprot:gene8301-15634_t
MAKKSAAKKSSKASKKAPKKSGKASKAKAAKKVVPKAPKPVNPVKFRKQVLAALTEVGYAALKANGSFVLPGFAKFVVRKRPARKAGKGINPFTKE